MDTKHIMAAFIVQLQVLIALSEAAEALGGHWGAWGALSPCSVTCGSGTISMERVWIPGPGEPASNEPFTSTRVFSCIDETYPECPEDGVWSAWAAWKRCSRACGGGVRERVRECRGQPHGGRFCEGEPLEKEDCRTEPCPVLPSNFDLTRCKDSANFTCISKKMCIPLLQKCDKTVHCHDGSDEEDCPDSNYWWRGNVRYDLSWGRNGVISQFSDAAVYVGLRLIAVLLLLCH